MALLDLSPNGTYLSIVPLSGLDAPVLTPYSARGLSQTYEPIKSASGSGSAWLRRDVNGIMESLVDTRFRKYRTTVSCSDGESPCLDEGWIGALVELHCAFEFSYVTGAPGSPSRPVVTGSSRVQGSVTYYRPILICYVADIRSGLREYLGMYDWQIDFEEK